MEKVKASLLSKISMIVFTVVGVFLFAFLVFLCAVRNVEVQQSRTDGGVIWIEDYVREERADAEAPIGVTTEYRFTIRESLAHDTHLAFYTVHQYVEVYLDEEAVYRIRPSQDLPMIKTPGSNWVMVPIYREDAGKEVRVVVTPVYASVRNREVEFLLGSELAIYVHQLTQDMPQLMISGLAVLVGFIFLCMSGYRLFVNQRGKGLLTLGLFAISLGLWRFTDTRFSPFFLEDKPVLLLYISSTMLMISVIPLMLSLKERYQQTGGWVFDYYCSGAGAVCIVQFLLQILGIMDFHETLHAVHIMIFAGALIGSGMIVFAWIKHKRNPGKNIEWILVVGALADTVAYYVKGTSSYLMFTLLAFLVFVIILGIQLILNYNRQERLVADQEQQIMQSRAATMMSQIRSHFVFNILNAISGMCKYDPEKADKTVVCFARYLRTNIDIMQDDQPVTFCSAMRHLEDYVALEQIRFGDKIRFITDITVDQFMIPSLILQPIVENAIKHGIAPKSSCGTITLCAWREETEIRISIRDDGVGFDTRTMDCKKSVGLNNVRFRLQHIMHGKLEIASTPGSGTTVTISIPYEGPEK